MPGDWWVWSKTQEFFMRPGLAVFRVPAGSDMAGVSQLVTGGTSEGPEQGWGRNGLREAPSKAFLRNLKKVSPRQTIYMACRKGRRGKRH